MFLQRKSLFSRDMPLRQTMSERDRSNSMLNGFFTVIYQF